MLKRVIALAAGALCVSSAAHAAPVQLIGGQTNVVLDTAALAAAASLTLSGVSPDVIAPGSLPGSVAFGINPRTATPPALSTTFAYDTDDFLGTFSGRIEHAGSVFFNAGTVEVGDFTIAFDAARVGTLGGAASGFYVESTAGIPAILFDIEAPTTLVASAAELRIGADLLVSPEFGSFLFTQGLSTVNLSGVDVGDALVEGIVPSPAGVSLAAGVALAALRRRRA